MHHRLRLTWERCNVGPASCAVVPERCSAVVRPGRCSAAVVPECCSAAVRPERCSAADRTVRCSFGAVRCKPGGCLLAAGQSCANHSKDVQNSSGAYYWSGWESRSAASRRWSFAF